MEINAIIPENFKDMLNEYLNNIKQRKYELDKRAYFKSKILEKWFETVRKLANRIEGNTKPLDLRTPDFCIEHIDPELKDKILAMTSEKRKAKKINKSTLWYEKKMLNQGKTIKILR
ncbi:MAG: hypothetical protein QXJ62_04875 [Nitrososphaeria archaeon]